MQRYTGGILVFVLILSLSVLGCASRNKKAASQPAGPSPTQKLTQAYALLYAVSSQAQQADGILKIKKTTPKIEKIVTDIAEVNRQITASLKTWAQHDTTGALSKAGLPEFEQRSRNIITKRVTLKLLLSGKKKSIKLLLLAQFQVLQYEGALLKIIVDNSTVKQRRTKAGEYAERVADLETKVFDQIAIIGQSEIKPAAKGTKKQNKK